MSTTPYSLDLREKVIDFLNKGKTQKEASEIFKIHRNTISRWYNRFLEEGNCEARKRLGYKSKLNHDEIKLFVKNNPNVKLIDIGNEFGISASHAGYLLKKLGFTYKKKPSPTWKQVKKGEMNIKK
jgi:transposase